MPRKKSIETQVTNQLSTDLTTKPKEGTNDQGEIIRYLKQKEYDRAWEEIKYVGWKIIPSMEDRYIFFQPIAEQFDYNKNNNFIIFYAQRLGYIKSYQNKTFLTTVNRNIIKQLLRQGISPDEEEELTKTVLELLNWESGGIID